MKRKSIYILLISLMSLSACSWIEDSMRSTDYSLLESYQIENTSSDELTLSFFREGEPCAVYGEILNQNGPIFITKENAVKLLSDILEVTHVTLQPGQTIIFYQTILPPDKLTAPTATCLKACGGGTSLSNIFRGAINFMGDSVNVSGSGRTASSFPMTDSSIWETWYDEKNFIYYHLWQIDN